MLRMFKLEYGTLCRQLLNSCNSILMTLDRCDQLINAVVKSHVICKNVRHFACYG